MHLYLLALLFGIAPPIVSIMEDEQDGQRQRDSQDDLFRDEYEKKQRPDTVMLRSKTWPSTSPSLEPTTAVNNDYENREVPPRVLGSPFRTPPPRNSLQLDATTMPHDQAAAGNIYGYGPHLREQRIKAALGELWSCGYGYERFGNYPDGTAHLLFREDVSPIRRIVMLIQCINLILDNARICLDEDTITYYEWAWKDEFQKSLDKLILPLTEVLYCRVNFERMPG